MQPTTDTLLTAAGLQPGERIRIVCPACGGGSTSERSMSVARTEDGRVLWHCFRAGCENSGGRGGGSLVRTRLPARAPPTNPFTGELIPLGDEQQDFLRETIGWTDEHRALARPLWAPEQGRYAFPIFGPMGVRRGYVLRAYTTTSAPKALNYMDVTEAKCSWYVTHPSDSMRIICVEDIPSAVRASTYMNSVALLGVSAGTNILNELAANATDVVWALDADATAQATRLHRDNLLSFDSSAVLPLRMDLKDMGEEELKQTLEVWI